MRIRRLNPIRVGFSRGLFLFSILISLACPGVSAQPAAGNANSKVPWIRPDHLSDAAVWGIENGIVVGLWPAAVEPVRKGADGGPRGLLRIGYSSGGSEYLINFIAVEPVVNGEMEFSEVSPSRVDGKWGKFMWAADSTESGRFSPGALTRGIIRHPDTAHPDIEELSIYVFMEAFLDSARPYLRLSIRSDRPGELGLQIFNETGSAQMERCALTATMGNYSRLRLLYLKDETIRSGVLYKGYNGIGFADRDPYPARQMFRNGRGDFFVAAESDESFASLADWPQDSAYVKRSGWRYRPFYKLTQYWRTPASADSASLQVRVNGRARYWAGGSDDPSKYVPLPGGVAFENFELRERYRPGQIFYFGLTTLPAKFFIAAESK